MLQHADVTPLQLSHYTCVNALGAGLGATLDALRAGRSGLAPCAFEMASDLDTAIGEVSGLDGIALPTRLVEFDCRNNRLALAGLRADGFEQAVEAAIARHGLRRIGVLLGTSTAGILETEQAYCRRDPASAALPADFHYAGTHNTYSVGAFVHAYFGLQGPAMVMSTACSSSAKVFASAARMMAAGLIDAAIVGGVDSLCLTTMYGFNSLELLSRRPCRPYAADRDGISIGEAAAFVLLEKAPLEVADEAILLLGVGESSDAHHMSSPHPDGLGAQMAMQAALASAGLRADAIDYINLHGTATPSNDAAEGKAVAALFGDRVACSSTKGATGHTLGAAGGMEAVIAALALQHGFMPGGLFREQADPNIPIRYLDTNLDEAPRRVLSNSFGFGGSNCSLILGRGLS